jgi:hypothetical protein
VVYASSSSALATGSALYFSGTNLGVGSTSPLSTGGYSTLRINGSTGGLLELTSGDTRVLQIQTDSTSSTTIQTIANGANPQLIFGTDSTERMRLTNTGLGIGTSSPAWKLDVQTASSRFQVRDGASTGGTNSGTGLVSANTAASALLDLNYRATNHAFIVDSTEGMRLTSTGLGIGTSSPAAKLHVKQSSDAAYTGGIRLERNGATNQYSFLVGGDNALRITYQDTSERLLIDASGNVGLGVTPSAWGSVIRALQVNNTGMSLFTYTAAGTADQYAFLSNNSYQNSSYAETYVRTNPAAQYRQLNATHAWFNAPSGTAGNPITFTQAATLTAGGNYLLGGTSDSNNCRFVVTNTNSTRTWGFGTSGSATAFYVLDGTSGSGVYVTAGGTSWTGTSDERLKTDLKPIENAVEKVKTLRSVTGRFKTDEAGTSRAFLIAQDVLAVLPEAVDTSNPEKYGIAYTDVIPLLVAAIKELKTEFDAYKAEHP